MPIEPGVPKIETQLQLVNFLTIDCQEYPSVEIDIVMGVLDMDLELITY